MSLTRRHIVALAAALKSVSVDPAYEPPRAWQHEADCNAVADVIGEDNRAFDRERFLKDCGVT